MEKSCEMEVDFMGRDEPRATERWHLTVRYSSLLSAFCGEKRAALCSAEYTALTLARKLHRRLSMIGTATLLSNGFVRPSG